MMPSVSAKRSRALAVVDAVGLVGVREARAADAEDQAAVGELVDGRGLLGDPQRMAERQHLHCRADLHALGALGDGGGEDHRRGKHRALGREVQLGEPHGVEAEPLGRIDLREAIGEGRRLAGARQALKFVEHAEFHRTSSCCDKA